MSRVRIRRFVIAAAIGAASTVGAAASWAPVHAMGCPDPDNPCDLKPPSKVGVPSITFGCGTVTVTEGDVSKTFAVLPCPGPYL